MLFSNKIRLGSRTLRNISTLNDWGMMLDGFVWMEILSKPRLDLRL